LDIDENTVRPVGSEVGKLVGAVGAYVGLEEGGYWIVVEVIVTAVETEAKVVRPKLLALD
jgi:hypothetical protein